MFIDYRIGISIWTIYFYIRDIFAEFYVYIVTSRGCVQLSWIGIYFIGIFSRNSSLIPVMSLIQEIS